MEGRLLFQFFHRAARSIRASFGIERRVHAADGGGRRSAGEWKRWPRDRHRVGDGARADEDSGANYFGRGGGRKVAAGSSIGRRSACGIEGAQGRRVSGGGIEQRPVARFGGREQGTRHTACSGRGEYRKSGAGGEGKKF